MMCFASLESITSKSMLKPNEVYVCVAHGDIDEKDVTVDAPTHIGEVMTDPTETVVDAFTPRRAFHSGCGMPVEIEYR